MPSGNRRDKQIGGASEADRLAMLELIKATTFHNDPRLRITDFELQLPQPTQTYKTVRDLQEAHVDFNFWFALGRDAYLDMPTGHWEHGAELQRGLRMIVFGGSGGSPINAPNVRYMDIPSTFDATSSTVVRMQIAKGSDPTPHISPAVRTYIKKYGLYRNSSTDRMSGGLSSHS